MLVEELLPVSSTDPITECQSPTDVGNSEKEGLRKTQGKLRYKKLKQRLQFLSEQALDQGLLRDPRDMASPNKSRLMKLALELEKAMRTQAVEYPLVQSILKEVQKIVEHRREHDLLILRGARMLGTLSAVIRRFPSLHKNEAAQSMSTLDSSLKLLRLMLTLSSSREAFIAANQMPALASLLGCALMREERKIAVAVLHLLCPLIAGPNRVELHPLLGANVEYMLCSSLLKRLRTALQTALEEDQPANSQFLLLGFKFYHLLLAFSCQSHRNRPIYSLQKQNDSLTQAICSHFQNGLQMLSCSLIFAILQREQGEQFFTQREEDLSNFKINLLLYILKSINLIFEAGAAEAQQVFQCSSLFLQALLCVFSFAKKNFQESPQTKALCSEVIVLLGNLSFQNQQNQENIRASGLLQALCNHPLEYLMEAPLRDILVPTFCCLIHNNPHNFSLAFAENSVQPILNYLQRQISLLNHQPQEDTLDSTKTLHCRTLSRKTSVSSINSSYSKASISDPFTNDHFIVNNQPLLTPRPTQNRLEHRFRPQYWEQLVLELMKLDQ